MNNKRIRNGNEVSYQIEHLHNKKVSLALHGWIPFAAKAVLFYIHGIQSHAGWSFETGPELSQSNIAFYVLDRRGSGISGGDRGDIPSAEILLQDYNVAIKKVRDQHPELPLTIMGHSLGGSILAALVSSSFMTVNYDALIFCASALGKLHTSLSREEQQALSKGQMLAPFLINLNDSDYTHIPRYLDFIKNDKYCCRVITRRARLVLYEIEKYYWENSHKFCKTPCAYVHAQYDPLVDLKLVLPFFIKWSQGKGYILSIPEKKHYMWFTEQRQALTKWISHFVLTRDYTL